MIIYNSNGTQKLDVEPDSSSQHTSGVMMDNVVTLSFIYLKNSSLEVNDYLLFENEKFILCEPYRPIHKNNQYYSYESVKFYGTIGDCRKAIVLKMVNNSSESQFSLTASLQDHLQLVVDNINRVKNSKIWVVGATSGNAKNKTITYDGTYCIDALGKIAEAFETEWWVEGYSINATKAEFGAAIELGYGKGLLGLARDANKEVRFFTRLYPIGSRRNIDPANYGHDRLQLPDGIKYVDRNIELGVVEASEEAAFSHIYPKRIGTVSEVRSESVKIEGADQVIYYFKDDQLNFDPVNSIIEGMTMKIVFQSGELHGCDFEVNYKEGEFEIINQYPSPDLQLPGGDIIPQGRDQYILYNISMPDEYYSIAENEYKQAVDEYLRKYSEDVSIYKGQTDYVYLGEKGLILKVGRRVQLVSDYFEMGYRNSRIIKITRKLKNPLAMDLEISNSTGKTRLEAVEGSVADIQTLFKEQINRDGLQILRTWDSADPSDYNVFSALRSLKVFAKLVGGNIFRGLQQFYDGLQSFDFVPGFTGKGFGLLKDENGDIILEVDRARIRKDLQLNTLSINQIEFITNTTVFSNGGCIITKVDSGETRVTGTDDKGNDMVDYFPYDGFWRCWYDDKKGTRFSGLKSGDQVRCQRYDPTNTQIIKYYWRLVVDAGRGYVDISTTDADTGSAEPQEGDNIAQLGNRTDKTRQGAKVIDVQNKVELWFNNIHSYSMPEPVIRQGELSPNVSGVETNNLIMTGGVIKAKDGKTSIVVENDKIRIKGVLVQSESGDSSIIGVWRGAFHDESVYYVGDEVVFEGSSYRCKFPTNAGITPTDCSYWELIARKGDDGQPGIGTKGDDGKTSYFHVKYSPYAQPTSASQITDTPNRYIGTYVDFTEFSSTNPLKYKWSKFEGTDGTKGIPGTNGLNGKTSFLHIKYSNDGGVTFTSNAGETVGSWMGMYVDFTEPDSFTPSDYKWAKIKGNDGADGNLFVYKYKKNGSTVAPPTLIQSLNPVGWQDTVPQIEAFEYVWSTRAEKNATQTVLVSNWETPKLEGYRSRSGNTILDDRSTYSPGQTYDGSYAKISAVVYNSVYYMARVDSSTSTFRGIVPTDTNYWNPFGVSADSIATNLLFAELAYIKNLVATNLITRKPTTDDATRIEIKEGINLIKSYGKKESDEYAQFGVYTNDDGFGDIGLTTHKFRKDPYSPYSKLSMSTVSPDYISCIKDLISNDYIANQVPINGHVMGSRSRLASGTYDVCAVEGTIDTDNVTGSQPAFLAIGSGMIIRNIIHSNRKKNNNILHGLAVMTHFPTNYWGFDQLWTSSLYPGISLGMMEIGVGRTRVKIENSPFSSMNDYHVIATINDWAGSNVTQGMYVGIRGKTSNSFWVISGDNDSPNDARVFLMIIDMRGYI